MLFRMNCAFLLSVGLTLAFSPLMEARRFDTPTITIDSGVVFGTTTLLPSATASVNKFLGIPFAKSPPERFSPPQPLLGSDHQINATAWKSACIQAFPCESMIQLQAPAFSHTR